MTYYEKEIVDAFNKGREKGKQEAQKEELGFLEDLLNYCKQQKFSQINIPQQRMIRFIDQRIRQLKGGKTR